MNDYRIIHKVSFHRSGRWKYFGTAFGLTVVSIFYYLIFELMPLFERQNTIDKTVTSLEYKSALKEVLDSVEGKNGLTRSHFEVPASAFTSVSVEIETFGAENEQKTPKVSSHVFLRRDRAVLLLGFFVVITSVYLTLFTDSKSESVKASGFGNSKHEVLKQFGIEPEGKSPAVELFARDVQSAGERADKFFERSTLLLAGGIIMAFIGVAIFYVTLPETKAEETFSTYWIKVIRPTGVLFFLEAIAWFLLRQYRSLVEDYKWFYRLYLKRSNYLAASTILSVEAVRREDLFIAVSLVQEDFSGRLKGGETTETLEALKLPESGPVFEALSAFSSIKEKVKAEKFEVGVK
jgi:hypothetical protein